MRPIDADALIEYANNQKDKTIDANDIARFPTAVDWISVKDRLPEINKDVLILYESKVLPHETGYAITCLTDSFYFGSTPIPYSTPQWLEPWQYFRENDVITHWMPLPEPPKVVKQDD